MRPEYSEENLAHAYQAAVAMFEQERSPGNVHVFIEAINLLYFAATRGQGSKGYPPMVARPGGTRCLGEVVRDCSDVPRTLQEITIEKGGPTTSSYAEAERVQVVALTKEK